MSIEKVRSVFRSQGMEGHILEFEETSATVELAAHAVGCVCPFAVKDVVKVYLDDSMRRFATINPKLIRSIA